MHNRDQVSIINNYKHRFSLHGPKIEALAGGGVERAHERFGKICWHGIQHHSSVLDVGCGIGMFYSYLNEAGYQCTYKGIDLVDDFIASSREKYPFAEFENVDLFKMQGVCKYDHVISSQAFNNRYTYSDNYELMEKALFRSYEICNDSVIFDMMSTCVDYRAPNLFYYDPLEILKISQKITPRVIIDTASLPYQLIVSLHKR